MSHVTSQPDTDDPGSVSYTCAKGHHQFVGTIFLLISVRVGLFRKIEAGDVSLLIDLDRFEVLLMISKPRYGSHSVWLAK